MGTACLQYIDEGVLASSPKAEVFHLGITPLPGWTRTLGGPDVESTVFRNINAALGLRCRRRGAAEHKASMHAERAEGRTPPHPTGDFALSSRRGIVPIDRYSIVGPRRRDMIHPFFNAQFAIVQLMLNHMCPA